MKKLIAFAGFMTVGILLMAYGTAQAQGPSYIGSNKCAQCHGAKYELFRQTWHSQMLRSASKETVVGDFNSTDPDLTFTLDQVVYVVGGQFSQRYLTEIEGELYVLPAQWNVTTGEWVSYHPDDWQERPYTRYCAGCHTTGFDAKTNTWAEAGVQCEACHGPGSEHVALTGDRTKIINPALLDFQAQTEVCGQCHSRGTDPTGVYEFPVGFRPGGPLKLDDVFITATDGEHFWPDGSSKAHHQEYLDWKKSPHAAGVSCIFCHVSHSHGETAHQTRWVGNHRCLICHEEKKDLRVHIPYMQPQTAFCTDCHMPVLAQAGTSEYNFDFHSHTFWPPDPAATIRYGGQEVMPNACNLCHTDKTPQWAAQILGMEVGAMAPIPTPTLVTPPTPVPTATPFLIGAEGESQERAAWFLWAFGGLGLLVVVVVIVFATRGLEGAKGG